MEKEYLKQLFEDNRIGEFRQELDRKIPFYRANVIIYDISNIGTLLFTDHQGLVCAEFKITNFDCYRTSSDNLIYTNSKKIDLIDDKVVKKAYISTMSKMYGDYMENYFNYLESKQQENQITM